jgi:hypothetical protein
MTDLGPVARKKEKRQPRDLGLVTALDLSLKAKAVTSHRTPKS